MKLKLDHAHIGKTATECYLNIDGVLSSVEERNIRIGDFNKRVLTAIVREIYIAIHKSPVYEAKDFAKSFVGCYTSDDLIPFMCNYITDEGFRDAFNKCVRLRDYDSAVDLCKFYVTSFKGKELVFYSDRAMSMKVDTPKKAYVGVVLRSLVPMLILISKLNLISRCKCYYKRQIYPAMSAFGVYITYGHYESIQYSGSMPDIMRYHLTVLKLASMMWVAPDFSDYIIRTIKQASIETLFELFELMDTVYNNQFTISNMDIGLRLLVK